MKRFSGSSLLALAVLACSPGARERGHGAAPDGASGGDGGAPVGDAAPPESGAMADAAPSGDAGPGASRCTVAADTVTCDHQTLTLSGRTVVHAVPLGVAPAAGWPAVIYFQGSFVPGHSAFAANRSDAFGMFQLTLTVKALLDRGYAVIAPDAAVGGTSFWETNIPPYADNWSGCADDVLMKSLFASMTKGDFGAVSSGRLYAMGISSGGFMASRMAVSYRGRFRALADHSASYATCGQTCTVPTPLPSDHPPTLLLRGGTDSAVPMSVVQPYIAALTAEGHEVKFVTEAAAGHEWLAVAASAIPSFFDSHP